MIIIYKNTKKMYRLNVHSVGYFEIPLCAIVVAWHTKRVPAFLHLKESSAASLTWEYINIYAGAL